MKMNFKTLMMAAFAMTVGFSSCSNDDENTIGGDEKTMFFKLSNGPSSYMEAPAVNNGAAVAFSSGHLYFVSAVGQIAKYMTISSAPTSASNLNMTEAAAGTTLTAIPGNASRVVVVGNTAGVATSGNISAVEDYLLSVTSQTNLASVNLYGSASLTSTATPLLYEADVTLAPTVARIELSDITSEGNITGFKVTGIFIDNFEKNAEVDGGTRAIELSTISQNPLDFVAGSGKYPANYPYDQYTPALNPVGNVAKPASGVWAYNVFQSTNVPRIIIRLEDVTATGYNFSGPQFLTITGFKNAGVDVASFEGGKVYKIGTGILKFDENDLTPNPNMDEIDVNITVSTTTWAVVNVTPVL